MKIAILEADALGDDIDLSIFKELGEVQVYGASDASDASEKLEDADIAVINRVPMNAQTLKDAKNLKLITITGTGFNMIDKAYIESRGIVAANVRGYSTDSVAQHTFALALYLIDQIDHFNCFVKSGRYIKEDIFRNFPQKTFELTGKTWGIIGMGAIGRKVAQIAEVFGCRVIYYSTSGKNTEQQYANVSLDELLAKSDIVSVHAPLNEATEQLLDMECFRKMKRSAILINVARGRIIKEEELAEALQQGVIAGAGLDVFVSEPMKEGNSLLALQENGKLVLTPHIAWATKEARQRVVEEVYRNIRSFLDGAERNLI